MAYKKIRQDQLELLKGKQEEQSSNNKLIQQYTEIRDLGGELLPHQEKRLRNLEKEQLLSTETVSLEKKLTNQARSTNKIKSESAKSAALQIANLKKSFKTTGMTEESFKSQASIIEQIAAGSATVEEIQSAINDLGDDTAKGMKEYLESQKQSLKTQQFGKDLMSETDGIIGGLGSKIKGFLTNPLTAAVALLLTFNATQESIGKQFGAIGVTEFRSELAGANQQFAELGLGAGEAQQTISDLSNEFGISVVESAKLSENVSRLAVSTGASLADTTKLIGLFTQTQNLTGEQAANLLASTTSLANANNVAPDKVLADVAQSSEFFAQFADEGGENILRAAVQARKLGINLQSVEKVTSGLLDFQSSLAKEQEASVLIGRKLNFQKARELALTNDIEGATSAVVEQLGSAEEFNKLNAIQRKALADAAGLEVSELAKIVNKEKEILSLQGALSKQEIKPIPEEVLTQTAQLIGSLQSIGVALAEVLGPPLNMIVGLFSFFSSLISDGIGFITEYAAAFGILGAALVAYNSTLIIAAAREKKKAISSALSKAFQGTGGGPIGIALSIAAGLAAVGVINRVTSMEDGVIGPGGETMVSGPKGSIKLNDQDSMVVGTNLGGASGGAGVDTSKLEGKQNETNSKLERVASVLENALSGPRPALARAMGSSVGDSVENMA